ncbi:hypothetical protein SAMN05518849_1301 [Sphingobium sp. AP50]|uniref:hypothetical protein n=1 Tax=Sphingobium sp. AP50 TaxID=1884369 RepID=UPI0008BE3858|nr:hypothetical protein [Sphingobium sp. AP50]SEK03033.1 hypothetical protein SAMN05518849_1301 [Sphingobium sp. AP50]
MMPTTIESNNAHRSDNQLRLGDWLWRPWSAKLWWSGVPLYWLGMFASFKLDALAYVYRSAVGGYLNELFFPPIVALVLSYGFLRQWLVSLPAQEDGETDEHDFWDRNKYGPSGMLREFDPLDPASGALWIGSPLNPLNPGYINWHPS